MKPFTKKQIELATYEQLKKINHQVYDELDRREKELKKTFNIGDCVKANGSDLIWAIEKKNRSKFLLRNGHKTGTVYPTNITKVKQNKKLLTFNENAIAERADYELKIAKHIQKERDKGNNYAVIPPKFLAWKFKYLGFTS